MCTRKIIYAMNDAAVYEVGRDAFQESILVSGKANTVGVRGGQLLRNSPLSWLGKGDRLIGSYRFKYQELAFIIWAARERELMSEIAGDSCRERRGVWKLPKRSDELVFGQASCGGG